MPLLTILLFSFTETKIIPKKEAITYNSINVDEPLKTDDFRQTLNTEKNSNRSVEIAGLVLDSELFQCQFNLCI